MMSTSSATVGLDAASFEDAFPFHVIVDRALHIRQAGHSIRRLVPGLCDGAPLGKHFAVRRPPMTDLSFENLSRHLGALFLFDVLTIPGLTLKGQLVLSPGGDQLTLLGSPWLTDPDDMVKFGLGPRDFGIADPMIDYLFLIESQKSIIADANRLADDLARGNAELETRVLHRTKDLASAHENLKSEMVQRQQIEAELRQVHKLQAVGRLAAGIAHEINTPVQFVNDSVQFVREAFTEMSAVLNRHREAAGEEQSADHSLLSELRSKADLDYALDNIPRSLNLALEGLNRIAGIVRAMKSFAHPDQTSMTGADLNEAITSTLTIAGPEFKYVADLDVELGQLPPVTCHVGEINQVVLNLIVNGAHAIGDVVGKTGKKGRIGVRTFVDGDDAVVSISDTGAGIPADIHHRVFDPFFTTKEVGRGTGQGLALAWSIIVDNHRGTLTFDTQPERGTTFHVRIPIAPAARTGAVVAQR